MGILTILWEKWVEFRRDFYKITLAAMIAPLMYLIVFGMGIQTSSHGEPYLNFLIPGVVSLTTMNGSFNAIAQNLNVQRLYEKAFDQVMISPTPLWQFIAGQIIGGSLRGLYAGGIILLLTMPIGTGLVFNGWSLLVMFLNGAVFIRKKICKFIFTKKSPAFLFFRKTGDFFICYAILAIVRLDVLFSSSHDHISTCKKGCHCQCGHGSDR